MTLNIRSQNSFEIWIDSEYDEYPIDMLQTPSGDFINVVLVVDSSIYKPKSYLYKISPIGDTVSKVIEKADTSIALQRIILANTSPLEYLVGGYGRNVNSNLTQWFTWFAKLDESLDIIWEKKYQFYMGNYYYANGGFQLLRLNNGGYLHTDGIQFQKIMHLFSMSENGDSLDYRLYEGDSTGHVGDLIYNHDSTKYLLHTHFAHYNSAGPESQCIEVDFNLNQTKVMYYPRWFKGEMTAKLSPDGNILSSSDYFEPTDGSDSYIAVYKLDSLFNKLSECKFTHPDTANQGGHIMLDYYYPSYIYAAGTHNHQVGTWVPGPSWIVIAQMNENLEIINEKYIGGDATYNFKTLTATPDTGVLISATWYDFASQSYQRDVIIIKLNFDDLTTSVNSDFEVEVCNAIVYPNPGLNQLSIRTTIYNPHFVLYDANGKSLINKGIYQNITTFDVSSLESGIYFWQLKDDKKIIESGKWIKNQ